MIERALKRVALVSCAIASFSCSSEVTHSSDQSSGGQTASSGGTGVVAGASSTGGTSSSQSGGSSANAIGGAATGGTGNTGGAATGGSNNTGGAPPTGGMPSTGGIPAAGGTSNAAGESSTGGTSATGGVTATGGTGGVTATGGASSTSAGTSSNGGSVASGGTSNLGGTLSSGGTTNVSGGSTSAGGTGLTCAAVGTTIPAPDGCTGGPATPSCVNGPLLSDQPELLDDFEDCDTCLRLVAGRRGFWFRFDSTGYQAPEIRTDAVRNSRVLRALGATSSTNPYWGIAVWPNGTTYCDETSVDLSQYLGITFWAKNVTGAAVKLTVRDDSTQLNTANEGATSPTYVMSLGTTWAQYKVYWSDLKRTLDQTPALPSSIHIIKWEGAETDAIYDVSLDDVAFFDANSNPPTAIHP